MAPNVRAAWKRLGAMTVILALLPHCDGADGGTEGTSKSDKVVGADDSKSEGNDSVEGAPTPTPSSGTSSTTTMGERASPSLAPSTVSVVAPAAATPPTGPMGTGGLPAGVPSGGAAGAPAVASAGSCLASTAQSYKERGPFQVVDAAQSPINMYVPGNLPAGCRGPIVHFSNGTAMFCNYYRSVFEHLATWGFLVACYESTMTGSGDECIRGLDTLATKFPQIADPTKIGSTGHSQGGGAAITCAYLAEKKWGSGVKVAVHAIMPASGMNRGSFAAEYPEIKAPVFIMSGSLDFVVNDAWVDMGYGPLKTETYWYQAQGANHMNPQDWAAPTAVAFFRWKLLGDENAGQYIKTLEADPSWKKVKSK